MAKTIFITGATSGIGEATARVLAKEGHRLILCGRRAERLHALATELSTASAGIHTCTFDVRDKAAVKQAIVSLPEDFKMIDVLVNNAGNAHGLSPLHEGSDEDWDAMIDINVKGLLYVTRQVSPGMVERKQGHIINIGSIAGKEVYPNGNVYCASKHAVDALNQGMRMDLNPFGIRISAVNPGLVETEFSKVRFKGDEARAKKVYEGFEPLKGIDIANIVNFIIQQPAHVAINDVVVMPTAQASSTIVRRQ